MVAWDLNSDAAWSVTVDANVEADYEQDGKDFDAAFAELRDAVEHSGGVADALDLFLSFEVLQQFLGVVNHSASAVRGAQEAISAYERGDLEMAATSQRSAGYAQTPRDLPGLPRVILRGA